MHPQNGLVPPDGRILAQEVTENAALEQFVVSIDDVEQRTGLDFLSELADDAENALEARRTERVW